MFLVMQLMISDGSATRVPRRLGSLVFQRSPGGVRLGRSLRKKPRPQFRAENGISYFSFVSNLAREWTTLPDYLKVATIDFASKALVPSRLGGMRLMRPINVYIKNNIYLNSITSGLGLLNRDYLPRRLPVYNSLKASFFIFFSQPQNSYILHCSWDVRARYNFSFKFYNFEGSYFTRSTFTSIFEVIIPDVIKSPILRYYFAPSDDGFPSQPRTVLVKDIPVVSRRPGDTTSFT